jgi:tetratricopeptide (TPR) repeat protein
MSLLLEALKKAEKAKEESQRRAQAEASQSSAADPDATVVDTGHPVTTRDQLPDISPQLEILSEDIRPAAAPKAPLELALADDPAPAREPAPAAQARASSARAAEQRNASNADRATAQRVFEAKFKEPNPRLPFYITLGLLGAAAIGIVVYFWIQLRPAPALVNPNPTRAAEESVAPAAPAAAPAVPAAATSAPAAAEAIPGLPGGTPAAASTPAPATPATAAPTAPQAAAAPAAGPAAAPAKPAAGGTASPAPAKPAPAPRAPRAAAPATSAGDESSVSVNRSAPQLNPQLSAGYAAYQAGDLAKAREAYEQALREEPGNRDAMLGLAAVEMRAQRYDLADGYYQRILRNNPRDAYAQAGALALRAQQIDPVAAESRVKSLIGADPSNVLQFTLGNQYAQQGRWAEAQQAYFRAYAADPENPDVAYNLAVSLDHLRQSALALEYYRKALALAEKRSASFPPEAARGRIQQLAR